MEEVARKRRRHVELDRSLVRQIREVFGLAQNWIDGDVPILACLARCFFDAARLRGTAKRSIDSG